MPLLQFIQFIIFKQVEQFPESSEKLFQEDKGACKAAGLRIHLIHGYQPFHMSKRQIACDQLSMGHVPTFKVKKGNCILRDQSHCLQQGERSSPGKTNSSFQEKQTLNWNDQQMFTAQSLNQYSEQEGVLMQLKISFPLWLLQSWYRNLRCIAEQLLFNFHAFKGVYFFNAMFEIVVCTF